MAEYKDCVTHDTCPWLHDIGSCPEYCNLYRNRDIVRVVRCKDCVHMKEQFNARFCNIWCMYNGMGDEGFCNYGVRKDNE